MNRTIEDLLNRRSVRSFTDEPVSKEELEILVQSGMNAPSGGNRQPAIMVVVQDEETINQLERLNYEAVGNPPGKPFYGAKTVIVVLADKKVSTRVYDGALVMGNLMNAAYALGLGSCWIHRAKETFETEEGRALLAKWGIEGEYEGIGNLIVGHVAGEFPPAKAKKENYVYWV